MENFLDLAKKRQSCRKYADKIVEKEKLISCVKAAITGPSACNSQPWRFVIINDKEKGRAFAESCLQEGGANKFTSDVPAFIAIVEKQARLIPKVAQAMGSDQFFAQFDIGIAAAHIVLDAVDQGLSTCILGWLNQEKAKEALSLSDGESVPIVITLGYAQDDKIRPKARNEFEDICTYID